MMSTVSEKLLQVAQNNPKVYHSGQLNIIKNAECLKGSKSGSAFLIDDVSPVTHEMGVKVRSKNLIPYPFIYGTLDSHGITFTDNKDGTITLKGKNDGTELSNYNLFNTSDKLSFLKPNTDYYLSCNLDNIIKSLRTVKSDGTYKYYSYGNINFPPDETPDRLFIQIKTTDTTTYDNTVVKLQIELGTTATTYEPYNSDIQNVHSKNLLPFPYTGLKNVGVTEELNGVNFTLNEDGSVLIDGTASAGTVKYVYQNTKDLLGLKSGDVITGSKYVSDSSQLSNFNLTFNYYDSTTKMKDGMTLGSVTNKTTTITDDYVGWGIYFYIPSGKTISNLLVKPQLEIGSTATYYEKYHEPYPLVVKELGKNLFNVNDYASDFQYKDGIFSGNNKVSSKEYIYMDITNVWKIAYNSNLPITISFDLKSEIDGEIAVYTLGEYRINFNFSGGNLKVATTTEWQHFDITSSKIYFTTGTTGDYCHLSFYGIYGSGVIPSVKNLQIYLGDTIISEYEDYITPKEYIPTTDGVIDEVTNLYPNTTLVSNGDRVYIDCNYYKDIDKAYNKLGAAIALSEGE